jgi:hypothetical protein
MAARPRPYGGDRRRKEEARKAKQEAKRQRRLERKGAGTSGPEIETPAEPGAAPVEYVWLSPSSNRTVTTRTAARPNVPGVDDWVLLSAPPKPSA